MERNSHEYLNWASSFEVPRKSEFNFGLQKERMFELADRAMIRKLQDQIALMSANDNGSDNFDYDKIEIDEVEAINQTKAQDLMNIFGRKNTTSGYYTMIKNVRN